MKKMAMGMVVAVGLALAASSVYAWNMPSGGDLANMGGKVALQSVLNKKLADNNCAFKKGTANTTCDLNKIGKELAAAYTAAKEGANYRVYINIEADDAPAAKKAKTTLSGSERANQVSDKLRGSLASAAMTDSWHYNTKSTNAKGDNLKISVEVK